MGSKYSIYFTVAFSKSLYLYNHKKSQSFPEILPKTEVPKFQKTEFDKYATSGDSAFSMTSIYLIQFIMD